MREISELQTADVEVRKTSADNTRDPIGESAPRLDAALLSPSLSPKNLAWALWLVFTDYLLIVIALIAAIYATDAWHGLRWGVVQCVSLAAIARALRGFECLVHEASHYNWSKKNRSLNDLLADYLAAFPTFSRVADYRKPHNLHHVRYGEEQDPDFARHQLFLFNRLSSTRPVGTARNVLAVLPRYKLDWFARVGTSFSAVMWGTLYHFAMIVAAAAIETALAGVYTSHALLTHCLSGAATLYLGILIAWPLVRLIGEASEHVYSAQPHARTTSRYLIASTISNVGLLQRLLFHPHGDGYHLAHHLFPYVPGWHLKAVDRHLAAHAEIAHRKLYRLRVFEPPRHGAAVAEAGPG